MNNYLTETCPIKNIKILIDAPNWMSRSTVTLIARKNRKLKRSRKLKTDVSKAAYRVARRIAHKVFLNVNLF